MRPLPRSGHNRLDLEGPLEGLERLEVPQAARASVLVVSSVISTVQLYHSSRVYMMSLSCSSYEATPSFGGGLRPGGFGQTQPAATSAFGGTGGAFGGQQTGTFGGAPASGFGQGKSEMYRHARIRRR